jgi:hypothetical protein
MKISFALPSRPLAFRGHDLDDRQDVASNGFVQLVKFTN